MSALGALGGTFLPPVVMSIIADASGVRAGVAEAKAEMTGLQATASKMEGFAAKGFIGLGIGAAVVGVESAKMAMNFNQALTLIHTQAGAVGENLVDIKQKILDLAPTVGQSPEKLAEALYHIESTGQRGAAAMDILAQSAKLASLGMADLDTVTYAMSGVMAVGMKDIHNASEAIAFMNATVGMGDMKMEDLARAVGTGILPSFKAAGLGMVDFSAALATITDNSVPADEAATRLRMTVALMAAPSGEAVKALEAIGISQVDAAHALSSRDKELSKFGITVSQLAKDMQQPDGLLVAIKDLKSHLEGLSPAAAAAVIEKAFGGGRTSGAILTLLEETDKLQSKYTDLGTAEDRAKKTDAAWAEQQDTQAQKWKNLKAQMEVYAIKLGEKLLPALGNVMDFLSRNKGTIEDWGRAVWKYYSIMGDGIMWWWNNIGKPGFQEIKSWLIDLANLYDTLTGKANTGAKQGTLTPNSVAVPGGKIPKFADGGTVPGPIGAPQLAIVHGGEQILSNDQLASMGRRSVPASLASGGASGGGDGGNIVVHSNVYLDSRQIRTGQLRTARNKGQSASTLLPSTVGALP